MSTYFIRPVKDVLPEHIQAPRRMETLRRSLDGQLCILVFDEGTEPIGWTDGMDDDSIKALLDAPSSDGIWYDSTQQ